MMAEVVEVVLDALSAVADVCKQVGLLHFDSRKNWVDRRGGTADFFFDLLGKRRWVSVLLVETNKSKEAEKHEAETR